MRGTSGALRSLLSLARLPGSTPIEHQAGCRFASGVVEREGRWSSRGGLALPEPYPLKDRGLKVIIQNQRLVGREMSKLVRMTSRSGLNRRALDRQVHVTPSEQRVLDRKAGELKRAKARFRTLMGYIMKRKERGF